MEDELVFVVGRQELFGTHSPQGLIASTAGFLDRCARYGNFQTRARVETDPALKQIIPYITVFHGQSLLCVRRLDTQSESRLHGLLSIGIGGHMNPLSGSTAFDVLLTANARRELDEELEVAGDLPPISWVAVINDDSTAVGSVHTGLLGLIDLDPARVRVREADKMTGGYVTYRELLAERGRFESWSGLVLDHWTTITT